jgi:adenine-specific DNA-methyltransferase
VDSDKAIGRLSKAELIDLAASQAEELAALRETSEEGIRITFQGKDVAKRIARKVQPRTSRTIAKYSIGTEEQQARNLIIEGENLQAMTTLYRDRGQVDLILTDPPYNTGRGFRYNDKWDEDPNDPDLGDEVTLEDTGRHTKWMRFMWPRLKVMKDMLKPSGVLAICIDHRELFRLGAMLDELFDEENRLAIINWQKSYAPKSDKTHVSTATEYVLVYAKRESRAHTAALPRTEVANARYKNADGDARLWKGGDAMGPDAKGHQGMVYGVQSPFTGEVFYPTHGNHWRSDKREVKVWLEQWGAKYVERQLDDGEKRAGIIGLPEGEIRKVKALVIVGSSAAAAKAAKMVLKTGPWPRLYFGQKGTGRPQLKNYLEDVKQGFVPMTYWANEDYASHLEMDAVSWAHQQSGHSQTGIDELDAIVGSGHGFDTVKPLRLFEKIVQIWCPPDGLVMDPFAGSGTAAHAVLRLNHQSGSTRRFIVMEQGRPERGDPYARSLLANRLRRAVTGDWASGHKPPLHSGYRFCQLQKTVDARALLEMERDEMTDVVIASHYDINKRGGPSLVLMTTEGYDFLVARNGSDEGFYLIWDGSPTPPVFDADVYARVVNEAVKAQLKPAYHVYARFNLFQSDDVRFYQIPDQILLDFGLNMNDPFNNDEAQSEDV